MDRKNKIVLSYHDCLLRQSDVDLLMGQNWINDALIGFYFEYLGMKNLETSNSSEILYASPELTQLLKMTDSSQLSIFLDPLNALQKNVIFFPLNNCKQRDSAGGSHWSLLVFSKTEDAFFHFDSFEKLNSEIAQDFAKNLTKYLLDKEDGKFIETKCPQQDNCCDCGLYVICFSDVLSEFVSKQAKVEGCNLSRVSEKVPGKRESLLELIKVLKAS